MKKLAILLGSLAVAMVATTPKGPLMAQLYQYLIFRPQDVDCQGDEQQLAAFNLVPNRLVNIDARDGSKLRGWIFQNPRAERIVLYCMGRNSDIPCLLDRISALIESGASVFVFEYRGFGKSEGEKTLRNMCHDAEAAYQTLLQMDYQPEQIVVLGESLGSGVAGWLALRFSVAGLVWKSAFSSLAAMARELYPVPGYLYTNLQYPLAFDNGRTARRLTVPFFVVHGNVDELIGPHHADTIVAAAKTRVMGVRLPYSPHKDFDPRDRALFIEAFGEWLQSLPPIFVSASLAA